MRYIDPYAFLELKAKAPIDVDQKMLLRAKQKLMATFDLSADGLIVWQDLEVSKSEALALLDQMEDPIQRLNYWRIRQRSAILAFLKDRSISPELATDLEWLQGESGCLRLCLQHLEAQLDIALRKAVDVQNLAQFRRILQLVEALKPQDDRPIWQGTVQMILANIAAMTQATEASAAELAKVPLTHYGNPDISAMLNILPPKHRELIDEYGIALIGLGWAYFIETDDIKTAWQAVSGIDGLQMHPSARKSVSGIYGAMLLHNARARNSTHGNDPAQNVQEEKPEEKAAPKPTNPPIGSAFREWLSNKGAQILVYGGFAVLAIVILITLRSGRSNSGIGTPYIPNIPLDLPDWKSEKDMLEPLRSTVGAQQKSATRLYDSLWDVAQEGFIDTGKPIQPQNGASMFKAIATPVKGETAPMSVENRSRQDIVLFVENEEDRSLAKAVYVRRNKPVEIHLPAATYWFRVYTGEAWVDSLTTFDGKAIGGFSRNVGFVGHHPGNSKRVKDMTPQMLGMVSRDKEYHLIYNGERLKWED